MLDGHEAEAVVREAWADASGTQVLDVMLEVDVTTYLPGDLLVKMDIATMAHAWKPARPSSTTS